MSAPDSNERGSNERAAIERVGDGYQLRLAGFEERYRVTVPGAMLDDEVGPEADEVARRVWIENNLAGILSALTARETGGMVREPWGRVLVEELS